MKRAFSKSRMLSSKAQSGTKRARQLPRPRTKVEERASSLKSGGAPPRRKRVACAHKGGHVLECGSVLPLLNVLEELRASFQPATRQIASTPRPRIALCRYRDSLLRVSASAVSP